MADEGRQRRVAERIRTTVTATLDRRVKDPRLGFMTVTDVRVTGDLQHATIYYTVLGDEKEQRSTRRALESAKGLIRSEVGAALGLRLTPTIAFQPDSLPEEAASIEDALKEAKARDAAIAAAAQGKQYAGGESPYREEATKDQDEEADTLPTSGTSPTEGTKMSDNEQAEELAALDQAWSEWREDDGGDVVLEQPDAPQTQSQVDEQALGDAVSDVPAEGTPQI